MGNSSSINQTINNKRKIYKKNQIKMQEKFILFYNKFITNYEKFIKKVSKKYYKNFYLKDITNRFIISPYESVSLKLPNIVIKSSYYKVVNLYKTEINTRIIKININDNFNKYYDNLIYCELFEIFNENYKNDIKIIISNMIILLYNELLKYINKDFNVINITENYIELQLKNRNSNLIDYNVQLINESPPSYDDIYPETILMENII